METEAEEKLVSKVEVEGKSGDVEMAETEQNKKIYKNLGQLFTQLNCKMIFNIKKSVQFI